MLVVQVIVSLEQYHISYMVNYHIEVRNIAVQYMRNNPERFIESKTDHSWVMYLANMSRQGTWCDALIIFLNNSTIINISHVDEVHYVSTAALDQNNSLTNIISEASSYNLQVPER
jgi:hypothetical protein